MKNANVLDAARKRIDLMFQDFDYVYTSFSGGKDSGVLLNLTAERAKLAGKRFGIFHIDYEAQYQQTTDYVAETFDALRDVADIYHICLPIVAQCATSMHQSHWTPWSAAEKDLWVREMPGNAISEANAPDIFRHGMTDYQFQDAFGGWLRRTLGVEKVACLVGIRSQESLNRWRAIWSDRRLNMHRGLGWTKRQEDGVFNAYPIHDWLTEDVWTANARFGWSYNKLYDLFHYAGVPLHAMRVASPFNDAAKGSLHLYRSIDPQTWGRMISRVNGVNFTAIYGGTTAMGWKKITKPAHHTWKSYMEFLLATLPEDIAASYRAKFDTSIKFWKEKGGVLDDGTVEQVKKTGHGFSTHDTKSYETAKKTVRFEEYPDDLDIEDFQSVPSYKRMCVCILKNDHTCKYMGFSQTKLEKQKREAAIRRYGNL